jgi:hypothetical protein
MTEQVPYCLCWSGQGRWPVRRDDRFCSLCGERCASVLPRGPVVEPGPPATLAAYLRAEPGGGLAGSLAFSLGGLYADEPRVRWHTQEGGGWLVAQKVPAADSLLLRLQARGDLSTPTGPLGRAHLEIELCADVFVFDVQLFALGAEPTAWMRVRDDQLDGYDLVVYRETDRGYTTLYAELSGVPVQWEHVRCDHPAASVVLLDADRAVPVARARIFWEPSLLSRDVPGEVVPFHVKLRDLDEFRHDQQLWWRRRRPLHCQPVALTVPLLTRGQNETWLVRFTNTDLEPLRLQTLSASVPWVAPAACAGVPVVLQPGQAETVLLRLVPEQINGVEGPHTGQVTFGLGDRGQQVFEVCVETVRSPRVLSGPLLVDPGPPRVVVAYPDPDGAGLVYLRGGSAGLEPGQLGADEAEYLAAVYDGQPTEHVLARLTAGALEHARRWGPLHACRVRLCRQPWLARQPDLPDVELTDWAALCLAGADLPEDVPLIRIDAWAAYFVAPSAGGPPHVRRTSDRTSAIGAAILDCLLHQWQRLAGQRLSRADADHLCWAHTDWAQPPEPWVLAACEALLGDYAWGPDYAWRRLLETVRDRLPSARRLPFDVAGADRDFTQAVRDYTRRVCRTLGQVLPAPPRACALVSALFARAELVAAVEAKELAVDTEVLAVPARWLSWLDREVAS